MQIKHIRNIVQEELLRRECIFLIKENKDFFTSHNALELKTNDANYQELNEIFGFIKSKLAQAKGRKMRQDLNKKRAKEELSKHLSGLSGEFKTQHQELGPETMLRKNREFKIQQQKKQAEELTRKQREEAEAKLRAQKQKIAKSRAATERQERLAANTNLTTPTRRDLMKRNWAKEIRNS